MLTEILPFSFEIDKIAIAGATLWSLALYLGFSGTNEKITNLINRWFNFAEGFMYISKEEFEKSRKARESQNAFYASVFSIVPFLVVGTLVNWLLDLGLGGSWGISTGILACMGCGVYELGRRTGESEED